MLTRLFRQKVIILARFSLSVGETINKIDVLFAGDWCDFRVLYCGLHRFFLPQDSPGYAGTGDTQHNSADFV